MDWNMLGTLAAWVAAVVTTVAALSGFIWWFAKFYGKICKIESAVLAVTEWVRDLTNELREGKSPVCSRHDERLDAHDRELEDHGRRITCLEQGNAIRRRPT